MTDPGSNDLESKLADARQRLDALRSRSAGGPAVRHGPAATHRRAPHDTRRDGRLAGPKARGAGQAADGRVRAVAEDGLIESVELDPRALRLDARELAGHLLHALNAALDAQRANAAPEDAAAGVDLAGLSQQLGAVRDQALRQLYQITSALQDAVAELRRDASVPGIVDVPDFEGLLDDTRRTLTLTGTQDSPASGGAASQGGAASRGGAASQGGAGAPRGEGQAGPGAQVRAAAGPGGHVESLSIVPMAVRRGTHELAGYVVAAVNAALEDAARQQRERSGEAGAERAELAKRVRTVQDLSLQQMRALGDALADLMASITPRA